MSWYFSGCETGVNFRGFHMTAIPVICRASSVVGMMMLFHCLAKKIALQKSHSIVERDFFGAQLTS